MLPPNASHTADPPMLVPGRIDSARLPILVSGVAGVAGYDAFCHLRNQHPGQVFAVRATTTSKLVGDGIVACDLEDHSSLRKLFDSVGFRSVLHCGGSCALNSCEKDPAMAHRVNVQGVESLLSAIDFQSRTKRIDVRFVALSIDLVFSGNDGGDYREDATPDPVTVYGKTMAIGETKILAARSDAAILRISLPMGFSFNGHAGAVDWISSRFKKNRPATLYYDEIRTPTYVDCLTAVCADFLNGQQRGIFHAGGPRKLSLYEIAQVVSVVGGFAPSCLSGKYRVQDHVGPPRAGNVTLNGDKLAALYGRCPFAAWPLDSRLVPDSRRWHFEPPIEDRAKIGVGQSALDQLLYRRNRL